LVIAAMVSGGAAHAQGQPGDPLQAELSPDAIRARLARLKTSELTEDARQQAERHLEDALAELMRAAELDASAQAFLAEAASAPGALAAIRSELASPVEPPAVEAPANASIAQVDQLAQRSEQELSARREELEQLRAEQARRGERRLALEQQMVVARQRLAELEGAVLSPAEEGEAGAARRLRLLAQREQTRSTLRAQEAELANYDARRELLPARIDRADRRVSVAQKTASAWQALAAEQRRVESEAATREAERMRLELARGNPQLLALAEANRDLATLRSGDGDDPGTTAEVSATGRELAEARELLNTLLQRSRSVIAKVQAAGLTNSMGLLLRKELESLPARSTLQDRIRLRQRRISDVQYRLILYGEERSHAGDVERSLAELIAGVGARSEGERADLERVGRELLTHRRDLLSGLLEDYEALFARLVELDTVTKQTMEVSDDYERFLAERILWVRSVSGGALPDLGAAAAGARWLVDGSSWGQGLWATWAEVLRRWPIVALGALAIFAVLFSRFLSRGRVRLMAEVVERDPRDTFSYTAWATAIVLVRATAFPALVWGVGWVLLAAPQQPEVVRATASGLNAAAVALFAYELLRQLIQPQGLGEVHFRWPREACAHVRKHLRWFIPVKLLSVLLVTTFDQQHESDLWNDALGRLCFMAEMIALGWFNQRTLRPGGPVFADYLRAHPHGWINRLRYLWYPLAIGLPAGLALLALSGYYYTALRLEERLQAWLWLILGLVLLNALFFRWLRAARRRLQTLQSKDPLPGGEAPSAEAAAAGPTQEDVGDEAATAARAAAEEEATAAADAESERESAAAARARELVGVELTTDGRLALPEVDAQTRHLFRSALALGLILGTFLIWADVLPALRRLDQVQLYPELTLLAPESPSLASDPAASLSGALPAGDSSLQVTLADLGLAILILAFTVAAAKNVPGLLEIIVLRRLPLDAGSRYAVIALVRYAIVLIGVPLGLTQIGISWERVQWLAAALTFGLAFGLQEIFANFVSGLIILFERPVRVGDVVTLGGTSGVVTRIRMRATTITDFDRKELIVPNKAFVTGEVVNWVLTDAVVRVVIPIGLGYDEDVDKARKLLVKLARSHPLVLKDPPASCQVKGLGASTFDLELWCFVASAQDIVKVRTDLVREVHKKLTAAGMDLPFPQQDLHLRSVPPGWKGPPGAPTP